MKELFVPSSSLIGVTSPFEYILGTDAEAYARGEALTLASGRLTKCAATAVPQFVCMADRPAETTATTPVPVARVLREQEYETTLSAAGTSLHPGDSVTISADGLQATATTTSGVFCISRMAGTAVGSAVYGYFVG